MSLHPAGESETSFVRRYICSTFLDSPVIETGLARLYQKVARLIVDGKIGLVLRASVAREYGLDRVDARLIKAYVDVSEHKEWIVRYSPEMISDVSLTCRLDDDTLDEAMSIADEISSAASIGLGQFLPGEMTRSLQVHAEKSPMIQHVYGYARAWEHLVYSIEAHFGGGRITPLVTTIDDRTFVSSTRWTILLVPDQVSVVMTSSHVLMIKDMLLARLHALIACSTLYGGTNLESLIVEQWEAQIEAVTRYGNAGYEIAKATESLGRARLTEVTSDIFVGVNGPFERMLEKLRTKEMKLSPGSHPVCDRLERNLRSTSSVEIIAELFGLQKLCGHPDINPARGGTEANAEAHIKDKTLIKDARAVRNHFAAIYVSGFLAKNGTWPPLMFTRAGTRLEELYRRMDRRLTRGSYPVTDWDHARFGKHLDFDYSDNFLDVIDDKSLCNLRSEAHTFWDKDEKPSTHRRLIIELLHRPSFNIREIFKTVSEGAIPFDWLVIALYPKEREFKVAARMFAMLVIEMRAFLAVAEGNIGASVMTSVSQQTMTSDKIEVHERLLSMTRPMTDDRVRRLYLEADLSRWNLRWRSLTVDEIGSDLNDMFGVSRVYTSIHSFFRRCMVYVRTREDRPIGIETTHPPISELVDYDQEGGKEGLAQKLWTLATAGMMHASLENVEASWTLTGQGDNQIFSILVSNNGNPKGDQLLALRDTVTRALAVGCARVNQDLKPEECVESDTVLTYSKDLYVHGAIVPTALKRLRLFPSASEVFPSVSANVGAVFAAAETAAEATPRPMEIYHLALVHAARYLITVSRGEGIHGQEVTRVCREGKLSRSEIIHFLILPSSLGGFPVALPYNFLYKQATDPLSRDIASLRELSVGRLEVAGRIISSLKTPRFLTILRPSALIEDPFSLPIKRPPIPADAVASVTGEEVRRQARNVEIAEILGTSVDEFASALTKCALTIRPFNPILARDIVDSSVVGVKREVDRMFCATASVQALASASSRDLISEILRASTREVSYVSTRLATAPRDASRLEESILCCVSRLREAWRLCGVEPPIGVTTVSPFDMQLSCGVETIRLDGVFAITHVTEAMTSSRYCTRGLERGYLGTDTRVKRSEHGFKIVGSGKPSAAARSLQQIISSADGSASFNHLINVVGRTRFSDLMTTISPLLTATVGGTIAHRYAARTGKRNPKVLGFLNLATHVSHNSSHAGFLSGSEDDYPVAFQEFFVFLTAVTGLLIRSDPSPRTLIVRSALGSTPLERLPEESMTCTGSHELTPVTLSSNSLVYGGDLELRRLFGPIAIRGIDTHDAVDGLLPLTIARGALDALIRAAFASYDFARVSADDGYSRFRLKIDILEMRGLTVSRVISSCAVEIAKSAIRDLLTSGRKVARHSPVLFVTRCASRVAQTLAPTIVHPLLRRDSAVRRFALGNGCRYDPGGSSASRLAVAIADRASEILVDGHSSEYNRRVMLFSSSSSSAGSDSLLSEFLVALYRGFLFGDLSASEAREAAIRGTRSMVDAGPTEEARQRGICRVILTTAEILDEISAVDSAKMMRDIAGARRISVVMLGAEEALRSARRLDGDTVADKNHPSYTLTSLHSLNQIIFVFQNLDVSRSGVRAVVVDESREDRAERQIRARWGKSRGGSTTAGYWFSSFAALMKGRQCAIVGSGLGGAAVVCSRAGATSILALDLACDLTIDPVDVDTYAPPEVLREGCRIFLQHHATFVDGGDISSHRVASAFLADVNREALIIVDIPSLDSTMELMRRLVDRSHRGAILFRAILSTTSMCSLAGDLKGSRHELQVYLLSEGPTVNMYMFVVVIRSPVLSTFTGSTVAIRHEPIDLDESIIADIGGKEDIVSMITARIGRGCRSLVELKGLSSAIESQMDLLEGGRGAYADWTRVLGLRVADRFSTFGIEEYITEVRRALLTKRVKWSGNNETIVTRELVEMLVTTLPRAL